MTSFDRLVAALAERYRVERPLGEGGMATVYLAHDIRHDRAVAIKVLRPDLAAVIGGDRFVTEIRTTANLQHPHILPLFDSGEAEGFLYYVMPYVEGESLRVRLEREKQLPIDEAVRITVGVARALEYAHRQGVIHRDVKPENVLLRDGEPVVVDFGIALAVQAAGGSRLTETGYRMGTPQYMSPEQATGEGAAGPASDVYALGCVLYEMLAGEPPFTGATVQIVLGRMLSGQPVPLSEVRSTVPGHVDAAVRKSLERLPADRFPSAGTFADALTEDSGTMAPRDGSGVRARRWKRSSVVFGAAAAVLLGSSLWLALRPGSTDGPAVYDVGLPLDAPISFSARPLPALSVSPRGDFVVYVAERDTTTELWYRSLRNTEAKPIPGTTGGSTPMISPDGGRVAFLAAGQLRIVGIDGGTVGTLANVDDPAGARWASERILIGDNDGQVLRWIEPASGAMDSVPVQHCVMPEQISATRVLCAGSDSRPGVRELGPGEGDESRVRPSVMDTALRALEGVRGTDLRLLDRRFIAFVTSAGELKLARFDPSTLSVGPTVTGAEGVRRESYTGAAQFAVAASGTLVYAPGESGDIGRFVRARSGSTSEPLPFGPRAWLRFGLAKDAVRVAAVVQTIGGQQLRILDQRTGRETNWIEAAYIGEPMWLQETDSILVTVALATADRVALVIGSPDAGVAPDTILRGRVVSPVSIAPDGRVFAWDGRALQAILVDIRTRPATVRTVLEGVYFPALSPDGRWIAYQLAATGQLFVERWPGRDRRIEVADGGWEPRWLDTKTVGFWKGTTWYVATLDDAGRDVDIRTWFSDPRFSDTLGRSWHAEADGSAIYIQGPSATSTAWLRVVPGWFQRTRSDVARAGR